ncbi:MAG TPA: thioredoxin domain-containing protein, partial [Casimicrobiaceae bacterium]|nr:thioredoxin domain-containing protein [Casimicrobiaceae bacterium]
MANRLAGETSPYLLQHADNPVEWYPWSEEALALARSEGRPILLSVGYSACHWCHVMAHESFEDPQVAAVMNANFVNIKVDREERPDLDQIYQAAHALLTRRSGGWPLTMFLTPDGAPFYGGTYFPKHGRYGLPGFIELLPRVAAAYREQGPAIAAQSLEMGKALASMEPSPGARDALPEAAPGVALEGLVRQFDPVNGGFGGAPKFPHETELEFCLREHALTGEPKALEVARVT